MGRPLGIPAPDAQTLSSRPLVCLSSSLSLSFCTPGNLCSQATVDILYVVRGTHQNSIDLYPFILPPDPGESVREQSRMGLAASILPRQRKSQSKNKQLYFYPYGCLQCPGS